MKVVDFDLFKLLNAAKWPMLNDSDRLLDLSFSTIANSRDLLVSLIGTEIVRLKKEYGKDILLRVTIKTKNYVMAIIASACMYHKINMNVYEGDSEIKIIKCF